MFQTLSRFAALLTLTLWLPWLGGCDATSQTGTQDTSQLLNAYAPLFRQAHNTVPEYTFAIHPLHNPSRLFENFQPLMRYLNARIPNARFRLEASRNYASFDEKLKQRRIAFALPNPYQTLMAIDHRYKVIAKIADDSDFRGIILVRKDSPIRSVADLKGKAVSYPAPSALAATMLPQAYLHTHGVDVMRDLDNRYVGSQESAIMNVYLGHTQAGATWPVPWRTLAKERPEVGATLKIIWQTETLPNISVVVRDDVPAALAQQVQTLITQLHLSPEGREVIAQMHLSAFSPADNQTYDKVRAFIAFFDREVRPLEATASITSEQ